MPSGKDVTNQHLCAAPHQARGQGSKVDIVANLAREVACISDQFQLIIQKISPWRHSLYDFCPESQYQQPLHDHCCLGARLGGTDKDSCIKLESLKIPGCKDHGRSQIQLPKHPIRIAKRDEKLLRWKRKSLQPLQNQQHTVHRSLYRDLEVCKR